MRNSLLAALSHDIRTPLTALVGLAETLSLELTPAGSDHADKADAIRVQAFRIRRLVENLLEMARLQSSEMKLRKDWQSIEEIVGSALKALEPSMAQHLVKLDPLSDLPLVKCDGALIERVLVNLLENATKYTPPGTTVEITAAKVEAVLRIDVWDEGSGLPPGQERAIFERFARGGRESAIAGVGLGLAICEAIVEAHGGKIWAENREPHGARLIFTLPLEEQPVVETSERLLDTQGAGHLVHQPDGPKGGSLFEDEWGRSSLERTEVFFVAQSESDRLDFLGEQWLRLAMVRCLT